MSGGITGPWLVCALTGFVRDSDNKAVAIPFGENGSPAGDETAFARARLIATAPELLEAAQMGADAIEFAAKCVGPKLAIVLGDRAMFLRAAIAKATGGAA